MTTADLVYRPNTSPLYPDQEYFLNALGPRCAALFPRYGAGKTRIALEYTYAKRPFKKGTLSAIVFCKIRNIPTWCAEIEKWFPNTQVLIRDEGIITTHKITREVPQAQLKDSDLPSILLVPHGRIFPWMAQLSEIIQRFHPVLIMDESTAIKNPKAKITQATMDLRGCLSPTDPVLALSGNPIPEHPAEIYTQFEYLYGSNNPFGATLYSFLRHWCIKAGFGYVLRMELIDKYFQVVYAHSVGMSPSDQERWAYRLHNKRIQYTMEYYEPSRIQQNLLKHLWENWELPNIDPLTDSPEEIEARVIAGSEEFNYSMSLLQKSQQISSGFYYDKDHNPIYLKDNPKLDLLIDVLNTLLEENPHRQIIVWQDYQAERDPMMMALAEAKLNAVAGPAGEALKIFEHGYDNNPALKPSIIVMPSRTSQGFNELRHADTAIFYSSPYSQELYTQAEERNTALRQQHPVVTIINLVAPNMADMDVVTALQSKSFTAARAATIVNKFSTRKERSNHVL